MKQLLNTLAATLLAHARSRAELAMQQQAALGAPQREHYASNAGGWN